MTNASKEMKINSIKESWPLIEKFVDDICENYYITNRYFGNIILALEEAVKNAIVHGNRNDPGKEVTIGFKRKPEGLSFIIEDEGSGFNINEVPNPLETEKKTGNGIFLMRTLADKVKFNPSGNCVEILFNISSINQETTITRIAQLNKYFQKHKTVAK